MATLNVWNFASLVAEGVELTGKQGAAADAAQTPFAVTVAGVGTKIVGTVATATVKTLWQASQDAVTGLVWLHFWADQTCYLQLLSDSSNVVRKVLAKVPYTDPGTGLLIGAANTTLIAGGAEPTGQTITKIAVGNYSGSTANYRLLLVD